MKLNEINEKIDKIRFILNKKNILKRSEQSTLNFLKIIEDLVELEKKDSIYCTSIMLSYNTVLYDCLKEASK